MVPLLIIGVTVVMVGGFLGVSYALGSYLHSRECVRAGPAVSDPCAQYHADRDWYEALPFWQQSAVIAWWLANRFACAVKGCK